MPRRRVSHGRIGRGWHSAAAATRGATVGRSLPARSLVAPNVVAAPAHGAPPIQLAARRVQTPPLFVPGGYAPKRTPPAPVPIGTCVGVPPHASPARPRPSAELAKARAAAPPPRYGRGRPICFAGRPRPPLSGQTRPHSCVGASFRAFRVLS